LVEKFFEEELTQEYGMCPSESELFEEKAYVTWLFSLVGVVVSKRKRN
jgi:hypothetical protein